MPAPSRTESMGRRHPGADPVGAAGPWPGLPGSHRWCAGAAPWLPGAGARRPAARRAGDRSLQPDHPAGAGPGGSGCVSWPPKASRWWLHCPVYLKENVEKQAGRRRVCPQHRGSAAAQRSGYGQLTAASSWISSTTRRGRRCPRPAGLEADYPAGAVAGVRRCFSTGSTPWPTCRSSGFSAALAASGQLDDYLALLRASHRPANLDQVMCRQLISVDWQGWLYDCDFNQQLGLPAGGRHLRDLLQRDPAGDPIQVAAHCFGCTAGSGSSCGGALAAMIRRLLLLLAVPCWWACSLRWICSVSSTWRPCVRPRTRCRPGGLARPCWRR